MSETSSRRNSVYITLAVGAAFLAVILYQQLATFPNAYEAKIKQSREQKDLQFRNDPQSPIPTAQRQAFKGLHYFPADPAFKVKAQLISPSPRDTLSLLTTTGEYRRVEDMGQLAFRLKKQDFRLRAFAYLDQEEPMLFVPFTDETTGIQTYGGGRYLDIPLEEDIFVDFNLAYNPYCVYNETYSCPIPPRENHLPISITAGESMEEIKADQAK